MSDKTTHYLEGRNMKPDYDPTSAWNTPTTGGNRKCAICQLSLFGKVTHKATRPQSNETDQPVHAECLKLYVDAHNLFNSTRHHNRPNRA